MCVRMCIHVFMYVFINYWYLRICTVITVAYIWLVEITNKLKSSIQLKFNIIK